MKKQQLRIPKYQGSEEEEKRMERDAPGYLCMACKQQWTKEADRDLRDKNDPSCPYCGSKGVRKWRVRQRD